jgi:hypothetical protein
VKRIVPLETKERVSKMKRTAIFIIAGLMASTAHLNAQSLLDTIVTPEKAVPVVNQSLTGLWLSELRRPGPTGLQPPIPTIITFFADGTSLGSPGDGTQTPTHAIWIRVGDRKFLGTGYFFNFNESRVLTTITKVRINFQLGVDGKTISGTTEAVILDPTGKVINTFPGATFNMVRLSFEIPGDFYDFQTRP